MGRYPLHARQRPRSAASAARAAATISAACASLGVIVSGRANPSGGQFEIDEQPVVGAVDVSEQAAVVIARLQVAHDDDVGSFRQRVLGELTGLRAEALDGRVRLQRLGRVDPDQADALLRATEVGVDRVAVDDPYHGRVRIRREARPCDGCCLGGWVGGWVGGGGIGSGR